MRQMVGTSYIRRKFDDYLVSWKSSACRLPLIVKGARQVGKTESIRNFARCHYENVVEINFALEPEYRHIVDDGYSADAVIGRLTRQNPAFRLVAGKTLIFFDEIQECPEAVTTFKSFAEDGRFDMIASGSLLGIHYRRIPSIPVGYKTDVTLNSLDFEEFLWARGYGEDFVGSILENLVSRRAVNETDLTILDRLFMDFCILGGMPQVVRNFLANRSFEGSLELQRQIMQGYRDDARKYADGMDQTRILNVLDHIPVLLSRENKKLQITKVAKGARFKDYRGCVEWLRDAGIVCPCYALNFPQLPLKGNYDESKCKLYFADTGLLVAQLDDEAQADLRANSNLGVYKGGLYENIVAEALVKQRYELAYYKREDSTLEEDFFVRDATSLIPVEVKSGNGRSKSLRTLIASEHYPEISWAIKFAHSNVGFANGVLTLPYSTAFLLRRLLSAGERGGR